MTNTNVIFLIDKKMSFFFKRIINNQLPFGRHFLRFEIPRTIASLCSVVDFQHTLYILHQINRRRKIYIIFKQKNFCFCNFSILIFLQTLHLNLFHFLLGRTKFYKVIHLVNIHCWIIQNKDMFLVSFTTKAFIRQTFT